MNLDAFRDKAYRMSAKASDINRQLAFAGIAIIWIFKTTSSTGSVILNKNLMFPLIIFAGSLTLDILHYLYSATAWRIVSKRPNLLLKSPKFKKGDANEKPKSNPYTSVFQLKKEPKKNFIYYIIINGTDLIFFLKIAGTFAAYILLIIQLWDSILFTK